MIIVDIILKLNGNISNKYMVLAICTTMDKDDVFDLYFLENERSTDGWSICAYSYIRFNQLKHYNYNDNSDGSIL